MDCSFQGSDNKQYHLSEITMGDLTDELPLWVQFRPFQRFQKMKDRLPPDDFKLQSDKILSDCAKNLLTINSKEVEDAQDGDPECSLFMIYLSLKRNHPAITFEQVKGIITPKNLNEAALKLRVMSGEMTEEDAKKKLEQSLMKASSCVKGQN